MDQPSPGTARLLQDHPNGTYRVRGRYPFPHTMLRYAASWPDLDADAAMMDLASTPPSGAWTKEWVIITLRFDERWCRADMARRWESFGWTVVPVE